MAKWISTKCCKPACFFELKQGRKTIANVKRISQVRKGKAVTIGFQVPRTFDMMGGTIGPIFPTLKAAKVYAEARARK